MNKILDRSELAAIVKAGLPHARAKTIEHAPSVMSLPARNYYDPAIFEAEVSRIFKRVPLILAVGAEMPNPGDYKTLDAAGVPVLLTRGQDGEVRAFVNSCSHRGTSVATEPKGNARRFVCPYHGWTFTQKGELMGIASAEDFGEIDKSCYGLVPLRVTERAGLIWGLLDPKSTLSFDAFLAGYDDVLEHFGFEHWPCLRQSRGAGTELEDRLRRLPRLLPPAGPAQGDLRRGHAEPGELLRLGSAPACPGPRPRPAGARWDARDRLARRGHVEGGLDHLSPRLDRQLPGRRPGGDDLAAHARTPCRPVVHDPDLPHRKRPDRGAGRGGPRPVQVPRTCRPRRGLRHGTFASRSP